MKTSGHLTTNGGIRGHSAGEFFPWRIMAKGTFYNLKWWVISPTGEEIASYHTVYGATKRAREEFNKGAK